MEKTNSRNKTKWNSKLDKMNAKKDDKRRKATLSFVSSVRRTQDGRVYAAYRNWNKDKSDCSRREEKFFFLAANVALLLLVRFWCARASGCGSFYFRLFRRRQTMNYEIKIIFTARFAFNFSYNFPWLLLLQLSFHVRLKNVHFISDNESCIPFFSQWAIQSIGELRDCCIVVIFKLKLY